MAFLSRNCAAMQERTWQQLMKQSKHLPLYSDDGIYLSSTSAPTSYLLQEIHFQKWIISKLTKLIELYKKKIVCISFL